MKKILLITPGICPNGILHVIIPIVGSMEDIDFTIAAEFDGNRYGLPDNIPIISLPPQSDLMNYFAAIYRASKSDKYDKAYIHANSAMMIVEAMAAKLGGIETVITHCHNSSSAHKLSHYFSKPFFNILADKKIGCSRVSSEWAYMGGNQITIPNGIDFDRFRFDPKSRAIIRDQLNVGADTILLGNFGRICPEKNLFFLLEAFTAFLENHPGSKLLLFDDSNGSYAIFDRIRELDLTDKMIILSPRQDVAPYYNALDAMVMPSLFEGLSLVALESQANGLPVIISDHLTQETYSTGYAVPVSIKDDPSVWAAAIGQAINMLDRGKNVRQQFEDAGLTETQMLSAIHDILIE